MAEVIDVAWTDGAAGDGGEPAVVLPVDSGVDLPRRRAVHVPGKRDVVFVERRATGHRHGQARRAEADGVLVAEMLPGGIAPQGAAGSWQTQPGGDLGTPHPHRVVEVLILEDRPWGLVGRGSGGQPVLEIGDLLIIGQR